MRFSVFFGVVNELGNVLGRSGLLRKLIGEMQADVVSLATATRAPGGLRVDVGVRAIRGQDLVMRAMANEFGTRTIPERSFLRATMDRNRQKYAVLLAEALEGSPSEAELERRLARIGAIATGDVQQFMTELRHPPNAWATIRKKGSDNPLIDTGELRRSIDARVARESRSSEAAIRDDGTRRLALGTGLVRRLQ